MVKSSLFVDFRQTWSARVCFCPCLCFRDKKTSSHRRRNIDNVARHFRDTLMIDKCQLSLDVMCFGKGSTQQQTFRTLRFSVVHDDVFILDC